MTYAIQVSGLTKSFRGKVAVQDVSFDVPEGEICALLGPNGAGKTTIIQCVLGLTLPDTGTVTVLGSDVVNERSKAIARTNFSASYTAFPWRLRLREVLTIYADLYGVKNTRQAVDEAIDLFNLGELARQPLQSMSSGQQTLVNLAKSLINRPELLILDEPTSSLDPEHAYDVREILRRLGEERGMTIFITSHNMIEIEKLAHRVLFLSKGQIFADGRPAELREQFHADDLEEVFLRVAKGRRE